MGCALGSTVIRHPKSPWEPEKQVPGWDEMCKNFFREMPIRMVKRRGKVLETSSGMECSLVKVLRGHQGVTEPTPALKKSHISWG